MITTIGTYNQIGKRLESYSFNPFRSLRNFILGKLGENVLSKLASQYPRDLIRIAEDCVRSARSKVEDLNWINGKKSTFDDINDIKDHFQSKSEIKKGQAKKLLNIAKTCIIKINKFDEREAERLARDFLSFIKRCGIGVDDSSENAKRFASQQ